MFKVPEQYRIKTGTLSSDSSAGNNGAFEIPVTSKRKIALDHTIEYKYKLYCIASDGMGWDHVSVHKLFPDGRIVTPQWNDMKLVKSLFWDHTDTVVQFHPESGKYVNHNPHVLHMWKQHNVKYELPPKELI